MKKFLCLILVQLSCMSFSQAKTMTDFELPIYGEKKIFKLSEQKGKTVVINFWASWCISCLKEMPELNELKAKNPGENYMFVAVNAGDTPMQIKKILSKYKFDWLILEDSSKEVSKSLGVNELPRTFVISPSGEVKYSDVKPPKNLN